MKSAMLTRLRQALGISEREPIDNGLTRINSRLGLDRSDEFHEPRKAADIRVEATASHPRSIFFSPDMDGQADSGEVVWVWAPAEGKQAPPRERAILVVGRTRTTVMGLLISPNPKHALDDAWLEIGAGEWDESGCDCWCASTACWRFPKSRCADKAHFFPNAGSKESRIGYARATTGPNQSHRRRPC